MVPLALVYYENTPKRFEKCNSLSLAAPNVFVSSQSRNHSVPYFNGHSKPHQHYWITINADALFPSDPPTGTGIPSPPNHGQYFIERRCEPTHTNNVLVCSDAPRIFWCRRKAYVQLINPIALRNWRDHFQTYDAPRRILCLDYSETKVKCKVGRDFLESLK